MQTNFRNPCNECPFLKTSIAGYLGPWHPQDILLSLANYPFPCHQTITKIHEDVRPLEDPDDPFSDPRLEACAGAMIFLNNKIEISRNSFNSEFQHTLKNHPATIASTVFGTRAEFMEHHGPRFDLGPTD